MIATVFKIKVMPIKRFGHPPGYKVYINGRKFPLGHGYWYATESKTLAIRHALDEYDAVVGNVSAPPLATSDREKRFYND